VNEIKLFPNTVIVELSEDDMTVLKLNCTCNFGFYDRKNPTHSKTNEYMCYYCRNVTKGNIYRSSMNRKAYYVKKSVFDYALACSFLKVPLDGDSSG
jgi:hypothetical protein